MILARESLLLPNYMHNSMDPRESLIFISFSNCFNILDTTT